jgi:lantibiotic transport system permease protein
MTFIRVLHAETLKVRGTIAWKMAILAPGIVVLLAFFAAWQAPFSTVNRFGPDHEWEALTRFCMRLWAILMLPLYIMLQSALLAGLDHAGGQWRSILARPLPRWTFYTAKLTFVIGLAVTGSALLILGIALDGAILPGLQREVVFAPPIPWSMILRNCAQVFGLAFAGLAIQNWISLRWQSFSVAMAAGIVLLVLGVFAGAVGQSTDSSLRFFPSALPMLIMARNAGNVAVGLRISVVCGVLFAIAAGIDFCRREVS